MKQSCIGNINGWLNNAMLYPVCNYDKTMLFYTIFCKRWWRWSNASPIMRAVIVIHHLETGMDTEIT